MMVDLVENLFLVTDFMPGNVHVDVVHRPHRTPASPVLQCTCKHVNAFALPVAIAKPLKWSDC